MRLKLTLKQPGKPTRDIHVTVDVTATVQSSPPISSEPTRPERSRSTRPAQASPFASNTPAGFTPSSSARYCPFTNPGFVQDARSKSCRSVTAVSAIAPAGRRAPFTLWQDQTPANGSSCASA